mmetsp:Transcript_6274/g.9515  ORF Transcript_6274/g.9515 Transcript_6274/m.9515 type:complete len:577 (+) Transcript_6274:207-1937(+)|eukprot:CAMPEP_0113936626 /NCGR_PEP_ID=MMETSP1339-20121228/3490_1 /TAXON_ID=94617 /ORGANISM="Fibrocapsa japonica" /LENGTH=576 /DNA_ID=CAMNT_0000939157 /DNA_START=197 /DNA_END=1927 /DNA_ORIENTATION=- /assembly_acc=CAM_ASM_000762
MPPLVILAHSVDDLKTVATLAKWLLDIVFMSTPLSFSIALDHTVDVADKQQRAEEPNGPQQDEESVRDDRHVAKVEGALQEAFHVGALEVVEEGVGVDEESGSPAAEQGAPPPTMVLAGQLEVHQGNSDEGGDDEQHDEGQEQDPKEGVDLVAPYTGKDVVQLNVDGTEGQEASHEHLGQRVAVPGDVRGDLAHGLGGAAGYIHITRGVAPNDAPNYRQGERHQAPQGDDYQDGMPGQGGGGLGLPGHGVDPAEDDHQGQGEHQAGHHHVPRPVPPAHLAVQATGYETANEGGDDVQDDEGGEYAAPLGGLEDPQQGAGQQQGDGGHQLHPRPNQGREQAGVHRHTEHVPVDQLPACLLFSDVLLVHVHVAREVVLEHPHEDDGEEGCQQQHQHEGVDDGEPVYLEGGGQEAVVDVAADAVLVGQVGLRHPLHAVAERHLCAFQLVRDVHLALRVRAHVHTDHLIVVVTQAEVQVGVQVAPGGLQVAQQQLLPFLLPHVAPHGQTVHKHLKVEVVADGIGKCLQLPFRQAPLAEHAPGHVVHEGDLVRGHHLAVPHKDLPQVLAMGAGLSTTPAER